MKETPLVFGPQSTLVGVLSHPDRDEQTRLAFLMFNAGVIPRIGPHRLNVKLARALAAMGHSSLRFDISGQGDSKAAQSDGDFRAQAMQDIRAAMNCLELTLGIRRFALIGICSGAVSGFATALVDPRLTAVLLFDGHWYRSRWTIPVWLWKRFRAASWRSRAAALRRVTIGLIKRPSVPGAPGISAGDTTPANPPRDEFAQALQTLVDRGVVIHLMYSGSALEYYSYANQFHDVFGREAFFGKVQCEFRPDIDHTFLSLKSQRKMIDSVLAWGTEVINATNLAT